LHYTSKSWTIVFGTQDCVLCTLHSLSTVSTFIAPALSAEFPLPSERTPQQVAERAIVLGTIALRASLEVSDDPRAQAFSERLLSWLRKLGCADELDPIERDLLLTPLGRLGPSLRLDANAAGEAATLFCWMLDLLPVPNEVGFADQSIVIGVLKILRPEASKIICNASLRDGAEIEEMCRHVVLVRSLLQEFRVKSGREFIRRLNTQRLQDVGLVVTDNAVAKASELVVRMTPGERSRSAGAYFVRDHAALWFMGNCADYFNHDDEVE
jgi:hypothetical protein